MKQRLQGQGGLLQQDRMIKGKLASFLAAIPRSYQGARFQVWAAGTHPEVQGLFNPVKENEDYDMKMISVEYDKGFSPGTYFKWLNTDTYWIVYWQDKTELAYFKGKCRQCNYSIQWIDKYRRRLETLAAVIGPSASELRTSSSMGAKLSQDMPNANLKVLVQDNILNREFFKRYQTFLIDGISYRVEQVDRISKAGIIEMSAIENYTNLVDDNPEENVSNFWNVLPILPEKVDKEIISGPRMIKPKMPTTFSTTLSGGRWFIVENEGVSAKKKYPVVITTDPKKNEITLQWNSLKSGVFTLAYIDGTDTVYQQSISVDSLF